MPNVTVSDTSCLILFYKIGELELLKKLFDKIYITEAVSKEFAQSLLRIGLKSRTPPPVLTKVYPAIWIRGKHRALPWLQNRMIPC